MHPFTSFFSFFNITILKGCPVSYSWETSIAIIMIIDESWQPTNLPMKIMYSQRMNNCPLMLNKFHIKIMHNVL